MSHTGRERLFPQSPSPTAVRARADLGSNLAAVRHSPDIRKRRLAGAGRPGAGRPGAGRPGAVCHERPLTESPADSCRSFMVSFTVPRDLANTPEALKDA